MGEERASQPVIDPDVPIEELVQILPQAPAILRRFGIVCIQCGEPVWGTLREVAAAKGISDLGEVMAALGAAVGSGESSGR
ncbi:MAG: DUF1858 domain-containing protein [Thermoanaerobaculaceae bacterium]|nr:DUF1858 domain-containing protein [Thermoanaerobaculaceae bacterium]